MHTAQEGKLYSNVYVIPDVHNKVDVAQKILDENTGKADLFVFLGDYFHSFGDEDSDMLVTGRWLTECIKRKDVVCLIGNHDASHMHQDARCSGWSRGKQAYWDLMAKSDEFFNGCDLMSSFTTGDLVLTHAGVYDGIDFEECVTAVNNLKNHGLYDGRFLDAHFRDGGSMNPAGILWGRPQYNKVDESVGYQIFGHTEFRRPVQKGKWTCLDTGLGHYAVVYFDVDGNVGHVELREV